MERSARPLSRSCGGVRPRAAGLLESGVGRAKRGPENLAFGRGCQLRLRAHGRRRVKRTNNRASPHSRAADHRYAIPSWRRESDGGEPGSWNGHGRQPLDDWRCRRRRGLPSLRHLIHPCVGHLLNAQAARPAQAARGFRCPTVKPPGKLSQRCACRYSSNRSDGDGRASTRRTCRHRIIRSST